MNCLDVKPLPLSEWTPSQSQAAPSPQHVAPQRGFSVMWHQFSNIFASFCFVGGPVLCKGHLFSCVYFLNSVSSPPSYSSAIKINKHNDVLSSEGLSDRQKKKKYAKDFLLELWTFFLTNCLLAFLSNQLLMENNAVCLCVFQAGYVSGICMWICAVPCGFSAATVWSDLPTEHHHTANTHTHTHIHVDQKYSNFFFKPMPAPGQDGWHVCVRHVYSEHAGLVSRCQELVCMWKSRSAAVLDMPRCS